MKTEDMKVNDLVICNEMDKPYPKHIMLVTKVEGDIFFGSYVSTLTGIEDYSGSIERATKVSDFGVEVSIYGSRLKAIHSYASKAKYTNGEVRLWQDNNEFYTPIRPHLLDKLKEFLPIKKATLIEKLNGFLQGIGFEVYGNYSNEKSWIKYGDKQAFIEAKIYLPEDRWIISLRKSSGAFAINHYGLDVVEFLETFDKVSTKMDEALHILTRESE